MRTIYTANSCGARFNYAGMRSLVAMQRTKAMLFSLLWAMSLIFLTQPDARAQTVTSGAVRGVVYEFGAKTLIAGATVTVTNRDTGLIRSALTDASGEYFIKMLPVGVYTVNGSMQGYEIVPTSTTNIPVRILDPSVVTPPPIELRKLGTQTVATTQPTGAQPTTAQSTGAQPTSQTASQPGSASDDVSESEQLVNTTNASRTQHFDSRLLLALPFSGIRTFDDLALLVPGVAPPPLAIGSNVGPGVGPGV